MNLYKTKCICQKYLYWDMCSTSWLALWNRNNHSWMVLKNCKIQLRISHMTLVTLVFWQVIIHQAVFFECYRAIILNAHRHWSLPVMPLMLPLVYSILNANFLLWLSTIHFKCQLWHIVFLFRWEACLCNGMSCLLKVIHQACLLVHFCAAYRSCCEVCAVW